MRIQAEQERICCINAPPYTQGPIIECGSNKYVTEQFHLACVGLTEETRPNGNKAGYCSVCEKLEEIKEETDIIERGVVRQMDDVMMKVYKELETPDLNNHESSHGQPSHRVESFMLQGELLLEEGSTPPAESKSPFSLLHEFAVSKSSNTRASTTQQIAPFRNQVNAHKRTASPSKPKKSAPRVSAIHEDMEMTELELSPKNDIETTSHQLEIDSAKQSPLPEHSSLCTPGCQGNDLGPWIACDDDCGQKWFHYAYVNLASHNKPKRDRTWLCQECRETRAQKAAQVTRKRGRTTTEVPEEDEKPVKKVKKEGTKPKLIQVTRSPSQRESRHSIATPYPQPRVMLIAAPKHLTQNAIPSPIASRRASRGTATPVAPTIPAPTTRASRRTAIPAAPTTTATATPEKRASRHTAPLTFCTCAQPETDDMIACDANCTKERFHFACVGLTKQTVPERAWYRAECEAGDAMKWAREDRRVRKRWGGSGGGGW